MTTFVTLFPHTGGSHTVWADESAHYSSADRKDLLINLVSEGTITEPGIYLVCRPTDQLLDGHLFTVDDTMDIHYGFSAQAPTTTNVTHWPPR